MSIDHLQNKIRKLKNPSVLELNLSPSQLPSGFMTEAAEAKRCAEYYRHMLAVMRGIIPAVRFSFSSFAVLGSEGLESLSALLKEAADQGFYVILDAPEMLSPATAQMVAERFFEAGSLFACDGIVISGYPGSDIWKPFVPYCEEHNKDIFVVVRTGSKSAPELQDLLTGTRLVHVVAADHVNRYGAQCIGKSGYSRISIMASASSQQSLRSLRSKYPRLFLLVEGYDYPSANAKNCAAAFDRLGHGAAVCAGPSITCAWMREASEGDPMEQALAAAERMKKNLARYVTVL